MKTKLQDERELFDRVNKLLYHNNESIKTCIEWVSANCDCAVISRDAEWIQELDNLKPMEFIERNQFNYSYFLQEIEKIKKRMREKQ